MQTQELHQQLFFIPLLLIVHNIEEALTMPQWMGSHLTMLQEKIPLFQFLRFSTPQLYVSLTFVTIIPLLVSFFCLRGEQTPKKIAVMLTLQSIIFWNALMPHLSGTAILGMYNPGAITAILINIPFSVYLFRTSSPELLFPYSIRKIAVAGALLYLPLVYTNHLIAKSISSLL